MPLWFENQTTLSSLEPGHKEQVKYCTRQWRKAECKWQSAGEQFAGDASWEPTYDYEKWLLKVTALFRSLHNIEGSPQARRQIYAINLGQQSDDLKEVRFALFLIGQFIAFSVDWQDAINPEQIYRQPYLMPHLILDSNLLKWLLPGKCGHVPPKAVSR